MLDLHENRIEEAEQHKMKAFEITKTYQLTNDRFLLCKLKYIESALARRMGNYSKAKELLEDSVEVNERPRYVQNGLLFVSCQWGEGDRFLIKFGCYNRINFTWGARQNQTLGVQNVYSVLQHSTIQYNILFL